MNRSPVMDEVKPRDYIRTRELELCRVVTLGNQVDLNRARTFAYSYNYTIAHHLTPPANQNCGGFQEFVSTPTGDIIRADGMLIPPRTAVVMSSKDCPIGVVENHRTRKVSVFHGGRPAQTPWPRYGAPARTIIDSAVHAVMRDVRDCDDVHAYITAGICGSCFTHDHGDAFNLVEPFHRMYGAKVFGDFMRGGVDLGHAIEQRLLQLRVPEDNIEQEIHCTKEDAGLASYRNKDTTSNYVLVMTF